MKKVDAGRPVRGFVESFYVILQVQERTSIPPELLRPTNTIFFIMEFVMMSETGDVCLLRGVYTILQYLTPGQFDAVWEIIVIEEAGRATSLTTLLSN